MNMQGKPREILEFDHQQTVKWLEDGECASQSGRILPPYLNNAPRDQHL